MFSSVLCIQALDTNRRASEENSKTIPCFNTVWPVSIWPLQAGEENPVVHLSVVSLNGPLHTVVMKKPDDPRIGRVTSCSWLCVKPGRMRAASGADVLSVSLFSGESITSPWWNGPPAPNWLSTGWTEPRTTRSWLCAKLQLGSASRWDALI